MLPNDKPSYQVWMFWEKWKDRLVQMTNVYSLFMLSEINGFAQTSHFSSRRNQHQAVWEVVFFLVQDDTKMCFQNLEDLKVNLVNVQYNLIAF